MKEQCNKEVSKPHKPSLCTLPRLFKAQHRAGPGELVCSAHQTLHLPAPCPCSCLSLTCASPGSTAGLKASVFSVSLVWPAAYR